MQNPKISVVIPVLNGEKTLPQCLESVLCQSYKNYEIICVDNNSTDSTKQIIGGFAKNNPKIVYLFEKKRARGAARNRGEKAATGEIIIMTDCDCVAPQNWIEEMTKPIIFQNAVAVQGGFKLFPGSANYWTKNIQEEKERIAKERIFDKKIGLLDTGNFAIKKSVLEHAGWSSPNIVSGNDTDLEFKLKKIGRDIVFNPIKIIHREPDTAVKIFKKFFVRGKWNRIIRKKYPSDLFSKNSVLKFFAGICFDLLTGNQKFRYYFVTGLAWRLGGLYAEINRLIRRN